MSCAGEEAAGGGQPAMASAFLLEPVAGEAATMGKRPAFLLEVVVVSSEWPQADVRRPQGPVAAAHRHGSCAADIDHRRRRAGRLEGGGVGGRALAVAWAGGQQWRVVQAHGRAGGSAMCGAGARGCTAFR
jgi:hypothetical protein